MDIGDEKALKRVLQDKYRDMGAMTFHQECGLMIITLSLAQEIYDFFLEEGNLSNSYNSIYS